MYTCPFLGFGSQQDIDKAYVIMPSSDDWVRVPKPWFQLRLEIVTPFPTFLRQIEVGTIVEFESSGITTILILLRHGLALISLHLFSTLTSLANRCSTLVWSVAMLSVQVESKVALESKEEGATSVAVVGPSLQEKSRWGVQSRPLRPCRWSAPSSKPAAPPWMWELSRINYFRINKHNSLTQERPRKHWCL